MRIAPLLVENIVGSERAVMRPMTSVGYNFINLNLLECLIFLTIRKERETTVPMKYSLFEMECIFWEILWFWIHLLKHSLWMQSDHIHCTYWFV